MRTAGRERDARIFPRRVLRVCACGVVCLALEACVRYDETIEVDARGGGTATLVLSRPEAAAPSAGPFIGLFDARFSEGAMKKDLPEGVACDYTRTVSGGRIEIRAVYTCRDFAGFLNWAARTDMPFGNVSLLRKDGVLEYSRAVKALRPEELAIVRASLADAQLTFRFTAPGTLERTNAGRREGATAVWDFKAPELFEGRSLTARYTSGAPWVWVFAGAGAAVIALAVWWYAKKRR